MADWFAMSSRFYKDLDDMGVSENAQMCLARILGYIAEEEQRMDGFITKTALKKLGMRAVSRRVDELIRARILTPNDDENGYYVRTFVKWQGPLIAHVNKKNRDRDYQRQRYQSRADSRTRIDRSSDPHSNNNQKKRTTKVPEASHVSTADEHDSAPTERPSGPAIKPEAARLVRSIIPGNQPDAVRTALRIRTSEMLVAGTEPAIVEQALHAWMAKPGIGPNVLPSLVSDILKAQSPRAAPAHTASGPASTKAAGWLQIAQDAADHHSEDQRAIGQ